ncbi:MAG: glycosyltransferase, partial [Candidatus Latescibacteria bacterium]|nr:glycosyltransferase [bacterium]MBD3423376.1 glycosyltransferase [Candidatus Latescibacterota bacterium]
MIRGGDGGKKILYHLRTPGTGAEGVHTRGIVNSFRNNGCQVDFIWISGEGDPTARAGSNPYRASEKRSLLERLVSMVPGFIFALMEFCYNFWAIFRMRGAVRNNNYNFIYERHFFFSFGSGHIARRYGIPLVLEVNELSGFERVRKNYFSALARRCERYIFRRAELISVVSQFLKDTILERYPEISPEKIHVIPNGVEEEFFSRRLEGDRIRKELGLEGKKVFGFVGFLVPVSSWHSLDWFLPIFIESVAAHPDAVIMFVGGGPGKAGLEEAGRNRGFRDRMIFAGHVPNREVPHYIDAMDIGIIPHSNRYRSPIKMFEYAAAGKVLLAPAREPIEMVVGGIQNQY